MAYEMRLTRTALKVPVQRRALAFLRRNAPHFLPRLRDARTSGEVHCRFWQRGGGYDRNVTDPGTLRAMIEYIHANPVRRGLVDRAADWPRSSARFYEGLPDAGLPMDPLPPLD
jgi:putative transposase